MLSTKTVRNISNGKWNVLPLGKFLEIYINKKRNIITMNLSKINRKDCNLLKVATHSYFS